MARHQPLTPQHVGSRRTRSVRPHTGAELSRMVGDPDAVFADNLRDGVPLDERQADNLRRFYSANPRLDGPPRHYRIEDSATVRFTLADAIITAAIAVLIGMIVAGAFL